MDAGLMKQTKKELVGIILRKDAVEAKLRRKVEYLRWVIEFFGITETDIEIKRNEQKDED